VDVTLVLSGVGYRYAGSRQPSLLDIDLELPDGAVVGLVGASESGKTTLCLVASGLAPRTVGGQVRGHISLDGEDVDAWPMHRLSERIGIGFANPTTQLSQVAATVFEEVAFGPMNLAVERGEVIERTWSALATLGIEGLAERDPQRLSGGQLDPAGTRLVGDALERLARDGRSILVAEQKTDLLASISTDIVALHEGRIALRGRAADVLGDPALAELGVGEPSAVRLHRLLAAAGVPSDRYEAALHD
jgi:energy-coupling factor transporter ATP-binding protein EcfA2